MFSTRIPLAIAADFLAKLAAPDATGALEGKFSSPVEAVVKTMTDMVQNELKTHFAYQVYGNSLRGLAHHAIAEEFESHGADELSHADWLLRRLSVVHGPPAIPAIPPPPPLSDPAAILDQMSAIFVIKMLGI